MEFLEFFAWSTDMSPASVIRSLGALFDFDFCYLSAFHDIVMHISRNPLSCFIRNLAFDSYFSCFGFTEKAIIINLSTDITDSPRP